MYSGNYRHPYLDYKSSGIFLITFSKRNEIPVFSNIEVFYNHNTNAKKITTKYTPLGHVIREALEKFKLSYPKLGIVQHAIMPDHIHFIVQIKELLDEHLGKYLGRLKAEIKTMAATRNILSPDIPSVFTKGYNDQHLNQYRSLKVLIDYVRENPYRLWIKRTFPEFFQKVENYVINGENCRIYGNLELLKSPFKYSVVRHRRYTSEFFEKKKEIFRYGIDNGGIMMGAFIHPEEKEILYTTIKEDGKLIIFDEIPENDRWKPSGRLFKLCSEGRLLIVHPNKLDSFIEAEKRTGKKISKERCNYLNSFAESLE